MLPVFWLALYGSLRPTRRQHRRRRRGLRRPGPRRRVAQVPAERVDAGAALDLRRPDRRLHRPGARPPASRPRRREPEACGRAPVSQEESRKLVVSMAAVTEATRELARTTDSTVAREIICAAACTITGAHFAKLMEPSPDGDLVMSADHGLQGTPPLTVSLTEEPSGAGHGLQDEEAALRPGRARQRARVAARRPGHRRCLDAVRARPPQREGRRRARGRLGPRGRRLGPDRSFDAHARRRDRDGTRAIRPSRPARGHRAHRRPDRAPQQACLGGAAPARAGACAAEQQPALRRDARPRPLQGLQRRAWSPGRRPPSQAERGRVGDRAPRQRHARPLRRRGVHRRAARLHDH